MSAVVSVLLPVAHASHWIPYVLPAIVVLVAVVISAVREHRARGAAGDDGQGTD